MDRTEPMERFQGVLRGTIGRHHWAEFWDDSPELTVDDIVGALAHHLRGLRAVNTSWDSGLLAVSDDLRAAGWQTRGQHAVSPPVTDEMAAHWIRSSCGFDEWYFLKAAPAEVRLRPWCNHAGVSLKDHAMLAFPEG